MTRREPQPDARTGEVPGGALRKASWSGTGAFAVTAGTASLAARLGASDSLSRALDAVAFAVAVGLFIGGCVIFFAAYVRGLARSRTDQVAVSTLFFLAGDVPSDARRSLLGSLGVQVVVAVGTAVARPYTSLAAGALVPMYGLGLCGLWSARHATFPPRDAGPKRPSARDDRREPTEPDDGGPGSLNGS